MSPKESKLNEKAVKREGIVKKPGDLLCTGLSGVVLCGVTKRLRNIEVGIILCKFVSKILIYLVILLVIMDLQLKK